MALLLARRAALQAPRFARSVHIENKIHDAMPFNTTKRGPLAFKIVTFLGTGFALPFVAAAYQLNKA